MILPAQSPPIIRRPESVSRNPGVATVRLCNGEAVPLTAAAARGCETIRGGYTVQVTCPANPCPR
jgi:hypothetical protein